MRVPFRLVLSAGALSVGMLMLAAPTPGDGVSATLFDSTPGSLCLLLDGAESVSGTIGGRVLPGEARSGEIRIAQCDTHPSALLDLDVDFRSTLVDRPPLGSVDLLAALIVTALRYGEDDLLADDLHVLGDRNLLREIDSKPGRGNGDGSLSLGELDAGVNDLATPGRVPLETRFTISVRLDEGAENALQGDEVDLSMVFFLSERSAPDLNP